MIPRLLAAFLISVASVVAGFALMCISQWITAIWSGGL
jgi:hypothetical protein